MESRRGIAEASVVTVLPEVATQLLGPAPATVRGWRGMRPRLGHFGDRGYFKGEEILRYEKGGIKTFVPKPLTSCSNAEGRFDRRYFVYIAKRDEYHCPEGARAIWRQTTVENGMDPAPVLVICLSTLPDQVAMQDGRLRPVARTKRRCRSNSGVRLPASASTMPARCREGRRTGR